MEICFDNKVNLLKAFAIILVIAGHLQIDLVPLFPIFSFHMALFFFISGYLFKEEHLNNIYAYIKKKFKGLIIPFYIYSIIYLIISQIILVHTGVSLAAKVTILNYVIAPFVLNPQIKFLYSLWFVTQLFLSLVFFVISYKVLKSTWNNKIFHLLFFTTLGIFATFITPYDSNIVDLIALKMLFLKTFFSTFFIYLGFFYKTSIENKFNIYDKKCIALIIVIQSILWLFNKSFRSGAGMSTGIDYALRVGIFNTPIVPIITSITGIWISLFIINILYAYIKDMKFFKQVGENTYHIMANHYFIIYLITTTFLVLKNIPDTRGIDIETIYEGSRTLPIYFLITLVLSTYLGVGIRFIQNKWITILKRNQKNSSIQ